MMRSAYLLLLLFSLGALAGEDPAGIGKLELDAIAPADGDASSGQPSREQLAEIAEQGYVAIIDMRGVDEDRGYDERAAAESLGLEYNPLPIEGASAVNLENARKLGALLEEIDGPVLVHCGSGNRVGALVALLESDRGASADEALAAGRAAGLTMPKLEKVVRKRLGQTE